MSVSKQIDFCHALLRAVHRLIRPAEQTWIGIPRHAEGRADTEGDLSVDLLAVQKLWSHACNLFDFLPDDRRIGGAQEDDEFIPADPADEIALPETGPEARRRSRSVPDRRQMTLNVVDHLEVVKVDHKQTAVQSRVQFFRNRCSTAFY